MHFAAPPVSCPAVFAANRFPITNTHPCSEKKKKAPHHFLQTKEKEILTLPRNKLFRAPCPCLGCQPKTVSNFLLSCRGRASHGKPGTAARGGFFIVLLLRASELSTVKPILFVQRTGPWSPARFQVRPSCHLLSGE